MHRSAIYRLDGLKPVYNLLIGDRSVNILSLALKCLRRLVIHTPCLTEAQEAGIVKKTC